MDLIRIGAIALGMLSAQFAFAQAFPSKPISLVVPFSAGGGTDILSRLVADRMRDALKVNVLVENKPGASAQIGTRYVIDSSPDGHTLLVATSSLVNGPALFPKLPYDAMKQLRPVVSLGDLPNFLAVSTKHSAQTVREFIEMAKKSTNLNYSSAGPGTTIHMSCEWLKANAGFQATHIPFKGSGPSVVALGAGQVDFTMDTLGTLMPMVKSNRIRLLGVPSSTRHPQAPDVPTFAEAGLPNVNLASWFFVMAPAATPDPVVNLLNSTINEILMRADTRERLLAQGVVNPGGSIEQLRQRMNDELVLWGTVIKNANITVE